MDRQALIRRLEEIAGPQGVISERDQLRTYECDGLANFRVVPSVVVLPETADQAQGVVRACHEAGVPVTAAAGRSSPRLLGEVQQRCLSGLVDRRPAHQVADAARAAWLRRIAFSAADCGGKWC